MGRAAKAWLAVVAAVVMAIQTAVSGDAGPFSGWTLAEGLTVGLAALGAVSVYVVPNYVDVMPWSKTVVAVLTAAAEAALTWAGQGQVGTPWLTILLAAFTALGVWGMPNRPTVRTTAMGGPSTLA